MHLVGRILAVELDDLAVVVDAVIKQVAHLGTVLEGWLDDLHRGGGGDSSAPGCLLVAGEVDRAVARVPPVQMAPRALAVLVLARVLELRGPGGLDLGRSTHGS